LHNLAIDKFLVYMKDALEWLAYELVDLFWANANKYKIRILTALTVQIILFLGESHLI